MYTCNCYFVIWFYREVWQDDVFGTEGATNEEEVQCLHDIFFSSIAG